MTGRTRILRNFGAGLAALISIVMIAAFITLRTDWFREYLKQKIIADTEEGTGGKVDLGSFSFDISRLRAVMTDFVIHGNEPAGSAPFVRAGRVEVHIRLLTSIKHLLDIHYLGIDRLESNVMVYADGSTNIPTPKVKTTSGKTSLDTLIDLAVDRLDVTNGRAVVDSRAQTYNLRGDNLQAQLLFNAITQSYSGSLSLEPIYVVSGRQTPVKFRLTVPVHIERDRILLRDAKIASGASELLINGTIENLRDLKISARVNGRVALDDLKRVADLPIPAGRGGLSEIAVTANATMSDRVIDIAGIKLDLGESTVEASGKLKDPNGPGGLQLHARLALAEIGKLANLAERPQGSVEFNGTAKVDAGNNYDISGKMEAKRVSLTEGTQRIRDLNLTSEVHLDPHRLDLNGMKLHAFGGEFGGNASLEEFARLRVKGNLRGLELGALLRSMNQQKLPYEGTISGPIDAEANLKSLRPQSTVVAHARLSLSPAKRGMPVSGRINAEYDGAADNVTIADSYITLPHTRLNLNGSIGKSLNISMTSRDLNDLLAALPQASRPAIVLNGEANFNGQVTGSFSDPRITGHLAATAFSVEQRRFDALAADVAATNSSAAVSNGTLTRAGMRADFKGSVGLDHWKPADNLPLAMDASISNGDLADLIALAGKPSEGYSGSLSLDVHAGGTVGNPIGRVNVQAVNGMVEGELYDRINAQVRMADQLVTIPSASIAAGPARINLTAEYQHPRDSFTTGRLHAHVKGEQVDLARLRTIQQRWPRSAGSVQLDAEVSGNLRQVKTEGLPAPEFLLSAITGTGSARNLSFGGESYGNLDASARTSGQIVSHTLTAVSLGTTVRESGTTQLAPEYPTNADFSISNLPIERVLTLAKRTDISAKGKLSATGRFTGTMANPQGTADVDLANAVIEDERLDRVRGHITYLSDSIDVQKLEIVAGPSQLTLSAKYDHPRNNLQQGKLQFRVENSRIDLARIHDLQLLRPGLGGNARIDANGVATVQEASPRVLLRDLNANIAASGVAVQGNNLGDLTLTAQTAGDRLSFALNSNLANSAIQGRGQAQLGGDYPLDAQLTFKDLTWSRLEPLLAGGARKASSPQFEAVADGQATVNGPALKPESLGGSLQISRLQLTTMRTREKNLNPIQIQNDGPISAKLDHGTLRVEHLHMTGPKTDIRASGSVPLSSGTFDLNISANTNLGILREVDRDIVSSGAIVIATTVRGTWDQPLVNGRAELRNASFNHAALPNGLSNGNGVITFNGNSATIRNLTAETGGGKVTMDGFASFRDTLRFGLKANATMVRVRLQQGVSIVSNARLNLTGTTDASVASGTVTVQRITYAPQSDFGSILLRSAPAVQSSAAPSPILENMKLDIHVRAAPALAVQAAQAQNLQADADLRLRGTAAEPAVLGRVNISEGQFVFFGTTYTADSGTIAFYNPLRIEPILNLNLKTQAKGVDVILTVTGPVDNMKLSYSSDPPLQFQEIVSLLAAGKAPTSDPTILANQPSQPPQTFQQMGETQLLSKGVADPVASQLQRVFGVSQLKIDPSFTGVSEMPTAKLTLQQQVTSHLTFTYITALNDPNGQIIRAEWMVNPQWSAVVARDQNGIVNLNFFYKKQFR